MCLLDMDKVSQKKSMVGVLKHQMLNLWNIPIVLDYNTLL
jgi:hypothetical protein